MKTLASRYAQAFLDLALEHKVLEAVRRDLTSLKKIIDINTLFLSFLKSPIISQKDAAAVFSEISSKASFHNLTMQLLGVLVENSRKNILPQFIDTFENLLKARENRLTASVISARKLLKAQKESLTSAIEKKLNTKIDLKETIDPEIIGGIIVRFGPYLIDTSVKSQLNQLRKELRG